MPKKGQYTALFTHPAIPLTNSSNRKEIIDFARRSVRSIGGSARVVRNASQGEGLPIYECFQASTSGGVRGHYMTAVAKRKPEHCPDCHAPLSDKAAKVKFKVAPKTPLGQACRTCGQLGIAL